MNLNERSWVLFLLSVALLFISTYILSFPISNYLSSSRLSLADIIAVVISILYFLVAFNGLKQVRIP